METRPKNATRWSTRTIVEASGLNQSVIVRICRAFGLNSHFYADFKLASNRFAIEKIRNLFGLYFNPWGDSCDRDLCR